MEKAYKRLGVMPALAELPCAIIVALCETGITSPAQSYLPWNSCPQSVAQVTLTAAALSLASRRASGGGISARLPSLIFRRASSRRGLGGTSGR